MIPEGTVNVLQRAVGWATSSFEGAPLSGAAVFGVPIGGHFFIEGFFVLVIVYLLLSKSYKPPRKPLTEEVVEISKGSEVKYELDKASGLIKHAEDLESGFSSDVESKYRKMYEDDINPFVLHFLRRYLAA